MKNTQDAGMDAALAELNGGMPPFAPGDKAPVPAPSRESELTVLPPAPPSAVKRADAVHAVVAGGKGFAVKVVGEYYARDPNGTGKIKKPYEVEVCVLQLEGCLSVIKNKLLRNALAAKYADAVGDRTCRVVSTRALGTGAPARSNNVAFMDRPSLEAVVADKKIPVDLATFSADDAGLVALRDSVIDFIQNPDPVKLDDKGRNTVAPGDVGTFVYREKLRQEQRVEDAELAKLNPGLGV